MLVNVPMVDIIVTTFLICMLLKLMDIQSRLLVNDSQMKNVCEENDMYYIIYCIIQTIFDCNSCVIYWSLPILISNETKLNEEKLNFQIRWNEMKF